MLAVGFSQRLELKVRTIYYYFADQSRCLSNCFPAGKSFLMENPEEKGWEHSDGFLFSNYD